MHTVKSTFNNQCPVQAEDYYTTAVTVRNAICVYWSCHHRYYPKAFPVSSLDLASRRDGSTRPLRRKGENIESAGEIAIATEAYYGHLEFYKRNHCRLLTRPPKWSKA